MRSRIFWKNWTLKNDWKNVKEGKFSSVAGTGDITLSGSLIPSVNASKTGGFSLGSKSNRWSKLYVASTIDVSGSQYTIVIPDGNYTSYEIVNLLNKVYFNPSPISGKIQSFYEYLKRRYTIVTCTSNNVLERFVSC